MPVRQLPPFSIIDSEPSCDHDWQATSEPLLMVVEPDHVSVRCTRCKTLSQISRTTYYRSKTKPFRFGPAADDAVDPEGCRSRCY